VHRGGEKLNMDGSMLLQYYTDLVNLFVGHHGMKIEHGPEYSITIIHRFAQLFAVHHSGKNWTQTRISYCNVMPVCSPFYNAP
jgi:hypothetical protein